MAGICFTDFRYLSVFRKNSSNLIKKAAAGLPAAAFSFE